MAIFPGEPGLAGYIEAKDDGSDGDLELYDVQSSSHIVTTNKPTPNFFYRPDALPVAQSTVSEH